MTEDSGKRNIDPTHQSIAALLGGTRTFEAPRYQRNYAWGENQISAFLRDLDVCVKARLSGQPKHHFFGGLVTVDAKVPGSTRNNLEVVDGQQRLATFAILVSQLKRCLLGLADALGGAHELCDVLRQRADVLSQKYEIYIDEIKLKNVNVPRIALSGPDQMFFADLLAGNDPEPARKSNTLLKSAYRQVGEYLDETLENWVGEKEKANFLHVIHDVLQGDWTIIHMAATARADAYMLFQVLNDRGVGLTQGELMRSATLEALEQVSGVDRLNEVEDLWNEILADEPHDVQQALGWLYASQVGTWPSGSTVLDDYLAAFFPAMSKGRELDGKGEKDLVSQIRELRDEFNYVKMLLDGEWPLQGKASSWTRNRLRLLMRHLRYTDAMSFLIAACQLDERSFSEAVLLLERFAFRYHIISEARADRAREKLNALAVDIRRDAKAFKVSSLSAALHELCDTFASDDVFLGQIRLLRYSRAESNNRPLKYFLMALEDYFRWFTESSQGKPCSRDETRILDFEAGTIEHVYAENSEAPVEELEPLINTLGNLTFLSGPENAAAGAKAFVEKRAYFERSICKMNQEIAKNQDWTKAVVEARADTLTAMAAKIFKIG